MSKKECWWFNIYQQEINATRASFTPSGWSVTVCVITNRLPKRLVKYVQDSFQVTPREEGPLHGQPRMELRGACRANAGLDDLNASKVVAASNFLSLHLKDTSLHDHQKRERPCSVAGWLLWSLGSTSWPLLWTDGFDISWAFCDSSWIELRWHSRGWTLAFASSREAISSSLQALCSSRARLASSLRRLSSCSFRRSSTRSAAALVDIDRASRSHRGTSRCHTAVVLYCIVLPVLSRRMLSFVLTVAFWRLLCPNTWHWCRNRWR